MRTGPFVPPDLKDPKMAETRPGSVFTPAIAAWSSPGQLGALSLPPWGGYAAAGALLALAYFRKIPWALGLGGAAAAWYFLTPAAQASAQITSGLGITAAGTTIQFSPNSPGTLTLAGGKPSSMSVGGSNYPVLSTDSNPDGTVTYYLDNPA
jgi:hypothetical protein